MNQKILVLAGAKQSGKSSAANFIVGYTLTQLGRQGFNSCPTKFGINQKGQLLVNTTTPNGEDVGILDLNSNDDQFLDWAQQIMWPHVKTFAFADRLKQIAIGVFGLSYHQVYGTDDDKNTLTQIKWGKMAKFLPPRVAGVLKKQGKYEEYMTAREFLQYFGTNVCRHLYPQCWAESTLTEVVNTPTDLAIITDGRFYDEVEYSKNVGAKIIRLLRKPHEDLHESEQGLKNVPEDWYSLIIPEDATLQEMNSQILNAMYDWGWFSNHIDI